MILTENQGWGGAGAYLRELILAVVPLYDKVVVVSNRGGLQFGDLPDVILGDRRVEHVEIRYFTESGVWTALKNISGKLGLAAVWLVRRLNLCRMPRVCRRLLKRHRPDAVFCANHGHQRAIWAMMHVCGESGIPAATYLLGMPDAYDTDKPQHQPRMDELMWKAARFVLVNAIAVGDAHGRERGLPIDKVAVVPNGVPDRIALHRRRLTGQSLRVGTMGRLSALKGIHHLVSAVHALVDQGVSVELAVAGEGAELEPLRALAARFGIADRVRFVGFVPDEDADEFLMGLDVFVLASLSEGLPFSVMEAMRAELPIVASRVGGLPEMLSHGESGLLVDPGDEVALAHAIAQLHADPDLADRLGKAARKHFEERYTTSAMHEAIREVFVSGGMVPCACPDEPC